MMIGKRKHFFSLSLLTLFVAYQVGITMFSHVHYVNGVMLVHSHPSNNNQHNHTEGQILSLAMVSSFWGTEPVTVTVDTIYYSNFIAIEYEMDNDFLSDLCFTVISLRAPPYRYC